MNTPSTPLKTIGLALALMMSIPAIAQDGQATPQSAKTGLNAEQVLENLKESQISPEHGAALTEKDLLNAHIPAHSIVAVSLPITALSSDEVAQYISPAVRDAGTGIALQGFDPVGYQTEGKQLKGNNKFTAVHQGSTYQFASAENRDLFLSNATRYAPAYGGYCTETLASGELIAGDASNWTVHGNRLFLTKSKQSTKTFRENRAKSVTKANENWGLVENNLGIGESGVNDSYKVIQ